MKDLELIEQIKKGHHDKALKVLYKEFPKVKANILKYGGTKEQAQEIFNDSLLLLIEKVSEESFQLTSNINTFLYGIARFLWMNTSRKNKPYQNQDWNEALELTHQDLDYNEEKEEKLRILDTILDSITQKCKQILELFYYKKLSMTVIADMMQFSSINSAKTQKYKCLEKAIQLSKKLQS